MKTTFMLAALLALGGPGLRLQASPAKSLGPEMRLLWEEHISYTRNYIVSALAGLPDTPALSARLMENQDAIGAELGAYYGEAAGKRLGALLRDHILIASVVVAKAKAGDHEGLNRAQGRWAANGDELVAWFNKANPRWGRAEVSEMLTDHLKLTTAEVSARLAGDWAGDIKNCDLLRAHMMAFADLLSQGIAAQFPEAVKAGK